MSKTTSVARAFSVSGNVQGVGFRWYAKQAATEHGLTGWVANRPDGSVAGEVCGEADAVTKFLDAIRRGPSGSRVERVDTSEGSVNRADSLAFEIRR